MSVAVSEATCAPDEARRSTASTWWLAGSTPPAARRAAAAADDDDGVAPAAMRVRVPVRDDVGVAAATALPVNADVPVVLVAAAPGVPARRWVLRGGGTKAGAVDGGAMAMGGVEWGGRRRRERQTRKGWTGVWSCRARADAKGDTRARCAAAEESVGRSWRFALDVTERSRSAGAGGAVALMAEPRRAGRAPQGRNGRSRTRGPAATPQAPAGDRATRPHLCAPCAGHPRLPIGRRGHPRGILCLRPFSRAGRGGRETPRPSPTPGQPPHQTSGHLLPATAPDVITAGQMVTPGSRHSYERICGGRPLVKAAQQLLHRI